MCLPVNPASSTNIFDLFTQMLNWSKWRCSVRYMSIRVILLCHTLCMTHNCSCTTDKYFTLERPETGSCFSQRRSRNMPSSLLSGNVRCKEYQTTLRKRCRCRREPCTVTCKPCDYIITDLYASRSVIIPAMWRSVRGCLTCRHPGS